jgi:hypothetical protein
MSARPRQPDANATAVSPSLTRVRDATSDNAGSTCSSAPMITDNAIAAAIPARAIRSARRSSDCDKTQRSAHRPWCRRRYLPVSVDRVTPNSDRFLDGTPIVTLDPRHQSGSV